jgi:hypothetical protein
VPSDFAISSVASVPPSPPAHAAPSLPAAPPQAAATGASGAPALNPGLHLNPALNLVVLQFFNAEGEVTQSIPSQKQLRAYQQDGGVKPASSPG